MKKIAVIINGDLTKNRQGQINSALFRSRYLRTRDSFDIDIYCIQEYDSTLLRIIRKTEKPDFKGSYLIDDQEVKVIYKKSTLLDMIYEKALKRRPLGDIFSFRKIAQRLKYYNLISGHAIVGGKVAFEVNRMYGIPYSVTWHGSDIHTFPLSNSSNKKLINNIIRAASSNIFVSVALLNNALSLFHEVPFPHVLYNAPGDSFVRYSDNAKMNLRSKYNVSGDKVVAFVGNLVNVKNVFTLPEIFEKVRRTNSNAVFWIIGDGYNRKALEVEMVHKDIACKFWGNRQPEEMPDFMNCIDVLVLPSKNESFGMVLVEAIACGANCVGSKVGGIPEVIGGENSFELNDCFADNISTRINEMLSSTIVQTVKPEFSWEITAKHEESIFNEIVKKRIYCMNAKRFKILYYKFLLKYFGRFTKNDLYNRILKMEGFEVGKGTIFYSPETIVIDRQRPWMLKIGEYCKVTRGVTILTHDYSRSVLRRAFGEILGEARMTIIGNNVFIGVNSTILMGAQIGNNVIVGAGSVVGGRIPDNVVVAGNPAKVVRTLDEHYERRKQAVLKEAKIWFESYKDRYGHYPNEQQAGPFFPLFTNRDTFDYENDHRLFCNGDNMEEVIADFKKGHPMFESFEDFLEYLKGNN